MSNLTFNVIDVETANADRSSICQIGVVHVCHGDITDKWGTYINPETSFSKKNKEVHGIDEKKVANAPTMPEIIDDIRARLTDTILVSHSQFDKQAINQTMTKYGLDELRVRWLDSMRIVQCAWPDKYAERGYGLEKVTKDLGISYKPHDAVEDAEAAAKVTLCAMEHTGLDVDGWMERVTLPISAQPRTSKKREKIEGDPNGPLSGEVCALTGNFTEGKGKLGEYAASLGCAVEPGVTKKTTIFVVGIQKESAMAKGQSKSSNHRKAEKLITEGQSIKILNEEEFCNFLNHAQQ